MEKEIYELEEIFAMPDRADRVAALHARIEAITKNELLKGLPPYAKFSKP